MRMLDQGKTYRAVAFAVGVSVMTLYRWKKAGRCSKCLKDGPHKLSPDHEVALCEHICQQRPCIILRQLQSHCKDKFGVNVSVSYLCKMPKRHKITRKRATKHFQEQDLNKVLTFLQSLPLDEALSLWYMLDECSFTLNNAPSHAYSKSGERAVVTRPGSRGQRLSLILCIGAQGYWKAVWHTGGVKADAFRAFLEALPGDSTIGMDNASIHHASKSLLAKNLPSVEQTASARTQKLVYLPPYSPQLNPVELCFNVLKKKVRQSGVRDFQTLQDLVNTTLQSLNMSTFFKHCWETGLARLVRSRSNPSQRGRNVMS
jgi:transposase